MNGNNKTKQYIPDNLWNEIKNILTDEKLVSTNGDNNNYKSFKLFLEDFIEIGEKEIDKESIDLIFTDSPYSSDSIHICLKLANFANRVKPRSAIVT